MFLSRNKKNNVYLCKPQFYYIKEGFKGVKIIYICFRDEESISLAFQMCTVKILIRLRSGSGSARNAIVALFMRDNARAYIIPNTFVTVIYFRYRGMDTFSVVEVEKWWGGGVEGRLGHIVLLANSLRLE